MRRSKPTIVLTGFGPFPGMSVNVSSRFVAALADTAKHVFPAYRFEAHVLPTEWVEAPRRVAAIYASARPVAGLHFGVSSRARGFEIETRGLNRRVASCDASGVVPADDCLVPGGPDEVSARLPVALILARLRRRGIPVALSRDAGGYICNALLYTVAHHAHREAPELRTGFIHLPSGLRGDVGRRSRGYSSELAWDQAMVGGLEIVAATLKAPSPPA